MLIAEKVFKQMWKTGDNPAIHFGLRKTSLNYNTCDCFHSARRLAKILSIENGKRKKIWPTFCFVTRHLYHYKVIPGSLVEALNENNATIITMFRTSEMCVHSCKKPLFFLNKSFLSKSVSNDSCEKDKRYSEKKSSSGI